MDVVYRLGRASVAEVRDEMADAPSYSAVRALMGVLEDKGELTHVREGPRYVYSPTTSRDEARASALKRVLTTFFDGSPTKAMAALVDMAEDVSEDDLQRMETMIREARREGR